MYLLKDLPGIIHTLSDGTTAKITKYNSGISCSVWEYFFFNQWSML